MMSRMFHDLTCIAAGLLALVASGMAQTISGTGPVKIFILAGESNMHGKGTVSPSTTPGTLDSVVANDPAGKYQFLKSGGSYVTRADVGIRGLVFSGAPNPGNLTIGYGGNAGGLIGPELGFGHVIGDAYENKVLIVKVGVDGTTLAGSFCPPSSRVGEPEPLVAGDKGFYYKEIIRLVNEAKTSLGATPYEIAGLGWHQGWNDRVTPAYSAAYEVNMANFIQDIRSADKGLGVANLPIVIASAAMDGYSSYSEVEIAQLKMANAAAYPAFAGNVAVVDTRIPYDGLEFWQSFTQSPANEGYHWNRNGKSYLHIGMAMGDAMSLIAANRIPYRPRASGGPGGVTLTWNNGTETPTHVRVLRNGVEIAAAASADPPTFLDAAAPLGVNQYELHFTMPGSPCPPLTVSHNSGITGLAANQRVNGMKLTWTNNRLYAGIRVKRDGSVIAASLPGSATGYIDYTPPSGSVTYRVEPVDAGGAPVEVVVTVSAAPAGGAFIYEPFDMTPGSYLDGKEGGIGLDGKWSAGSGIQTSSANLYSFGTLPVAGNRIVNTGAGSTCSFKIGSVLSDAGLMSDGAQLWFSFLCQNTDNINNNPTLALGNDSATYFNTVANSGSAIGARLKQAKKVEGMFLKNGVEAAATATQATLGTSEVVLVVGRITWGANPAAPDTLDIYTPGTDLVLDAPQSVSAVVDQSTFDVISMYGNGVTPNIDEIRFGASYEAVIGQATDTSGDFTAPAPATMSFATPPSATSTTAITMTAITATDTNGVQYRFVETSGNPGGTSSGWQDSPNYTDTGLTPGTQYTYTVQARDKSVNNNSNAVSSPASATTLPPDYNPPPTPGFATAPNATSFSTITMTASVVTDPEGGPVEYFFAETSGNPGGTSSGWQSSPTYVDNGLNPNTQYSYTVKARDTASPPNESAASAASSATTPVKTPTTYIRQNNTNLLNAPGAWDVGDQPLGVDSVQWDATCAGNRSTALGGDVTWGKIIVTTGTAGAVTIGNTAGAKLSLNGVGGTGIDMSAAPSDLTINNLVTLGASQTWDVTTSRILTVGNYAISDGGSGFGITKAGVGTLTLQGSNTFSGPVTIAGGTVSINAIANGGVASPLGQSSNAASNLLLGNGTTLTYTGGAASSDRSFTINGSAAGHGATISAGGTGALNLTSTAPIAYGTADQTRTLTLSGNSGSGTNILSARITNNGSGAVTLSKTGNGNVWWVTNPDNNFTGGVTFNRGILMFSSGALGTTGKICMGANTAPPLGLRWAPGNTDDISARFNDTGTAGQCTLDTGANNVVFASAITMRADSWLIKEGSGSLALNTASSWGGGTNAATLINAGTLVAKVLANGGASSSVGNVSSSAFALGLRGGALKYTGSGATTDRNFHLSGNNTIDASGTGALIFSQTGVISPTPASRVFPLTMNSTSTGNATVTSADLVPGMTVSGTGIQAGTKIVSIGINGALTLDKTTTAATGNQTLSFGSYSAGTLTLTGTSTHANEIRGILRDSVSNIDATTSPLAITKSGTGKWVLSGANTYTGPTEIIGGTLALGASHVLPDGSAISLGSATLDAATFTDVLGTLEVAGYAVIQLGSGAALSFANSSAVDWPGANLNITGSFVAGSSLRFGNSSAALTPAQLAKISVNGSGSYVLNSNGYLIPATFASWAGANGTAGGLQDDHDNDGVANGIEYFLYGPNGSSSGTTTLPGVSSGTPSVTWTKAADYAGVYGTDYRVESSDTLTGTWTTETLGGNVTITGNEVQYTFPQPVAGKKFIRLKVTGP